MIDPADKPRPAQPWRRLLARAFQLAALALTTTAVGYPAVANPDWGIEAYDAGIADLSTHVANPGLCGQAPSDYLDMAEFLVRVGIDSMSLNPDTVVKTTQQVLQVEQQLTPVE